jgi:hypothetical protein
MSLNLGTIEAVSINDPAALAEIDFTQILLRCAHPSHVNEVFAPLRFIG